MAFSNFTVTVLQRIYHILKKKSVIIHSPIIYISNPYDQHILIPRRHLTDALPLASVIWRG